MTFVWFIVYLVDDQTSMNPVHMLLACGMFPQAALSGISCGKSVRSCRVRRSLFSSRVPALQQIAIRCTCMFDLLAFTALFQSSFKCYRKLTRLCCRGSTFWRRAPSLALKSSCWTSLASCWALLSGRTCLCLWICSAPSGRVWSVKHSTLNLTFEKPTCSHSTTSRSLRM